MSCLPILADFPTVLELHRLYKDIHAKCTIKIILQIICNAGIGLTVWTLAVAGGGLSVGFWSLVACRAAVGVGEASFVSLASTFIGEVSRSSLSFNIISGSDLGF
jgi:MFS family permease